MLQYLLLIGILLAIVYLFYINYILPLYHFKYKNIPHPKAKLIFGDVLDSYYYGSHIMQLQYMKQFGRIYGTLTGTVPIVWIAEPDIIKEINHINFPYLSNLELESTGIESVESLTKI